MNISYNWLKRYLKTDLSAEEMATILTDIGLEVESFEKIESIRGGLAGVVVGEVLTCTDHPDSDHLHLTTVDVGGEAPLQIVCGAPNCRQGLKVLCATVGAVLYPNGGEEEFKIKRSKIRGVESLGMLCAEDELGIGASHEGIMELPADAKVGQPAWEYLKLEDDYVIGIGLTPNRIDAASHIGVARDLAAYLKSQGKPVELQWPDVSAFAVDNHDLKIDVQVENSEAAPRYAGVTVKNCKIGPSPEWMQNCLRTAGITPKNNLVDITNFVLFELGQPLHAFDAAKFDGGRIVVRTCEEGTPFITLDGVERKLTANDLMICSAAKPMCIAGVYGGLDSGVSDTTTDVFIESAYFNPVWVRKTAKRFGLNTDSSFRFERGVDPDIQVYALKRAALLMKELAGGEIASEITDICSAPIEKFKVELDIKHVNSLIGKEIPADTIRTILGALDIKIEAEEGDLWRVAVPPYRGQNLRGRYSVHNARRRRAQAHGQRPDDLLGCETHVYCGRLRRVGFWRERYDDRRIHRERLFQPGLGAQDGQALRPEHRFFVPLRARRGSRHTGLCPQACRPADEGAGRRRDRLRNYGYLLRSYRKV